VSSSSWHSSNKRLLFLCNQTLSKPPCLLPLFWVYCLLEPPQLSRLMQPSSLNSKGEGLTRAC
ncbi:MAG: hypothetical protein ACK55Z_28850, partial [bacterium]